MVEILMQQAQQFLFSLGGSGLLGLMMGFFIKKGLKILAFVGGGIIALLAYLSWKNMISVNWTVISNETWNIANNTMHTINGVVSSVGDKIDAVNGLSVGGVGIGFVGGFLYGFKRG